MAKLEVAVRCPKCDGVLLFFQPIPLGTRVTCDTCQTEFPFTADRRVPESVLAAEAAAGSPSGGGASGHSSPADDPSSDAFAERPVWPLVVLLIAAVLLGLLIGFWVSRKPGGEEQIAEADAKTGSTEPSKSEPPKASASPAPSTMPATSGAAMPGSSSPAKDEPRPIPPPPPVEPPSDGKGPTEPLPPRPGGAGGLEGVPPPVAPPVMPPPVAPVGGGGGGGGTNVQVDVGLGALDPTRDAVPGVEWTSVLDNATGEEWGLWTDNTDGGGGVAPREARFRIRTTTATAERVTVELNPDADLTVAAPGNQFVLQGGNAAQEVRIQGARNAAFGTNVSKTSSVRTTVVRETGERLAGPDIQIVILDNAVARIVFMPMTSAATRPGPSLPDWAQISQGSRGLGFRVVVTQQPTGAGVTVILTPAASPSWTGPCDPAGFFPLGGANFVHGKLAHPPEGTATAGPFVINYTTALGVGAQPAFAAAGAAALNVRNGNGPGLVRTALTVTPWIAGCGSPPTRAEPLASNSLTGVSLASMLVSPALPLSLAVPNGPSTVNGPMAHPKDHPQSARLLGFVRLSAGAASPSVKQSKPRPLGFVPLTASRSTPTTKRARPRPLGFVWWSNKSPPPTQPVMPPGGSSSVTVITGTNECWTKVPSVVNLTLCEARKLLKGQLLEAEVPNSCARDDDYVKEQSVEAGKKVACGTRVKLDPVVTKVPMVTGMTLEQAYKILNQKEGFVVKSKGKSFSRVTKQEPAAGKELERCETVRLCCMVRVPQLVGTDFSQGLQQLKDLDLQGQQRATAYQGDVVFAQTPVAGTEVEVESIVSLTPGVAVPDLRGPVSEARRLLVESGLFGYLKYVRSIPMPGGGMGGEVTVDWQSVAPQTIVPRSKRITVSGYQYVPVYAQYYPQEYPIPPKRSINVIFGGGSSQTINNGCARVIPKVGDDDRPGQRLWGGAASPALVGKVGSGGTRGGTDLSDQYAQMGRSGRSTLPPVCGPAGGRGGSGMLWGSGSGGMGGMGGMGSGSMSKGGASGTGMF